MCSQSTETQESLSDVCPERTLPQRARFAGREAHGLGHLLSVSHGHLAGCRASASPAGNQASPQAGGDKWGPPEGQGDTKLLGQIEAQKKQALKDGARDCSRGAGHTRD